MKVRVPFDLYDRLRGTVGREYNTITSVSGDVNADGEVHLKGMRYDTNNTNCNCNDNFRAFKDLDPSDYKTITLKPKFNIGDEVIYLNDSPYRRFVLKRGKITGISFCKAIGYELYWYKVDNSTTDAHNIYRTVEEFKQQCKPKKELRDGEKFLYTRYCMQPNNLIPVEIEKVSTTHCKVMNGYDWGAKMRTCYLYNSYDKFVNKMIAQI